MERHAAGGRNPGDRFGFRRPNAAKSPPSAGARVFRPRKSAPDLGSHTGKGENLWKALHASSGDIICYIDGDIANFHAGFVTGLVGPLLTDPEIDYVKAYYERPLVQWRRPPLDRRRQGLRNPRAAADFHVLPGTHARSSNRCPANTPPAAACWKPSPSPPATAWKSPT